MKEAESIEDKVYHKVMNREINKILKANGWSVVEINELIKKYLFGLEREDYAKTYMKERIIEMIDKHFLSMTI